MILPMMGALFVLFVIGLFGGVILYVSKPFRRCAPFALVPAIAAIGALILSWTLALGLERALNSVAGGYGFYGGYLLGSIFGAWLGYRFALSIQRSVAFQKFRDN
jgi:hypothetical protein